MSCVSSLPRDSFGPENISLDAGISQAFPLDPSSIDGLADYLVRGFWQDFRQETPYKAFELGEDGALTVDITGLSSAGQQFALEALDAWSASTGIEFVQVDASLGDAVEINFIDDEETFGFPTASASSNGIQNPDGTETLTHAEIWISESWIENDVLDGEAQFDSYSLQTYIHEIGHALGLGHAGPYNGGADYGFDHAFLEDSWQLSVMSYFSQVENWNVDADYAYVLSPMAADLAGIRMLYDGLPEVNPEDNTYFDEDAGEGYFDRVTAKIASGEHEPITITIIDEGGEDHLDFSASTQSLDVDLTPGSASDIYGHEGALIIDAQSFIENVTGSSEADRISGNSLNNGLIGGNGADWIFGESGDDFISGGAGADQLFGGAGEDRVVLASSYLKSAFSLSEASEDALFVTSEGETDLLAGFEVFEFADRTLSYEEAFHLATAGSLILEAGETAHGFSPYLPDGATLQTASADHGRVIVDAQNGEITFIPNEDFIGDDRVSYQYALKNGEIIEGEIPVTIALDANLAPLAVDDLASVASGKSLSFNVIENDFDPNGDSLELVSAYLGAGEVSFEENGLIHFTPEEGFSGTAEITYQIEDASGLTDTGQLTVEVLSLEEGAQPSETENSVFEEDNESGDDSGAFEGIGAALLLLLGFAGAAVFLRG